MGFWEFISDDFVLAIVTYIGVFLTIYFSVYRRRKKIRFAVARNGSNYIIALWNARSHTIFREDISYLFAYGNVDCKCDLVHASDPDIPLEYKIGEDNIPYDREGNTRFNRHIKKIDFSFDFLPARHGYIVHIDNSQKEGYLAASLLLEGRVRGERRNSIQGCKECKWVNTIAKIITCFTIYMIFCVMISSIISIYNGIFTQDKVRLFDGLFSILIFSLPSSIVCYMFYISSMPFDVFIKYFKYTKKHRYQDITYEVNKTSRQNHRYRK